MHGKNYLVLNPNKGYPFGVLASSALCDELHGPFDTRLDAERYVKALAGEYSDYTGFSIVKIEIPYAGVGA